MPNNVYMGVQIELGCSVLPPTVDRAGFGYSSRISHSAPTAHAGNRNRRPRAERDSSYLDHCVGSPLTGPGTVMVPLRSGTLVLQSFVVTKPTYLVGMNFVLGLPNASAKVELGLYVNGSLMRRLTQVYTLVPPSPPSGLGLPAPNLSGHGMGMLLNTTFAANTVVTAAILVLNGTVIAYTLPPTGGLSSAAIMATYSLPPQLPTSAEAAPWSLSGVTGINFG